MAFSHEGVISAPSIAMRDPRTKRESDYASVVDNQESSKLGSNDRKTKDTPLWKLVIPPIKLEKKKDLRKSQTAVQLRV